MSMMAALFFVLILYLIPQFSANPAEITGFLILLALSLMVDEALGFIKYKRPVCAVSAAVTAGIIQILTPGLPLWLKLIGLAAALIPGKHLWGGTGKNPVNPAVVGLLTIVIINGGNISGFSASYLLIPALVLSLPFLLFRPFSALGLIGGLSITMIYSHNASFLISVPMILFFGCIIGTDPVTVTAKPLAGFVGALLAGLAPIAFGGSAISLLAAIIAFNLVSSLMDEYVTFKLPLVYKIPFRIGKLVPYNSGKTEFYDFTGEDKQDNRQERPADLHKMSDLVEQLEQKGVFGCSGAGFPAASKIRTVMEAKASANYFIINAVECDPGLIHDEWLLYNRFTEIIKGIGAIGSGLNFNGIYIAVKKKTYSKLPAEFLGMVQEGIKFSIVDDIYPGGAERILIDKVLKRRIPFDIIPANEGILVLNIQTIYYIYEALYLDRKQESKFMTVCDLRNNRNSVVRAHMGDSLSETLHKVYPGTFPVFAGGGVMQAITADEGDTVGNTTNFIASAAFPKYKESPFCSKCGLCRLSCPAGLEANRIADLVDQGELKAAGGYMPQKCMECGSCSYVCLAGRNLSGRVKEAKHFLKAQ